MSVQQHAVQGLWKEGVDAADGSAWRPWPVTQDWALMDATTTAAVAARACLVGILVLRLVSRGKGYDVSSLVLARTTGVFLLSAYVLVATISELWLATYSPFGSAIDECPKGFRKSRFLYIVGISKMFGFLDPVIMRLCRRFRRVTLLHAYHLVSIFVIWWAIVNNYLEA